MKVLVVLAQPPLPEGEAPARCALGLLRGLAAHGIETRVIAARQHYAVDGSIPSDVDVEIVDVPPVRSGWESLRPLRQPRGALTDASFRARVAQMARDVDVVHLEETQTFWAADSIPKPALLHVHYLVRRDRTFGMPWRRQFRDVLEFDLAERRAIRGRRFLVASSPVVADALRHAAPGSEVVLAPLTLDPAHYQRAPLDGPPVAGVIGTAAWTPTAAAVHRLVDRVWPMIKQQMPEAVLRIAGRGMKGLSDAQWREVENVGEVPSAAEFLRGLSLLVFPLERGSGVKVKVLESLATGLPVVTTSAGAEGLDGGEGIVIEADDAALAAASIRILRDRDERRRRGEAGASAFNERYVPEVATKPLVSLYERMART